MQKTPLQVSELTNCRRLSSNGRWHGEFHFTFIVISNIRG
jgi:hypothetical protein